MSEPTFCQSCGMPMREPQDFGGGRQDNLYCVHCSDEQGTLKPYEVVLEGMKDFAMRSMGVSEAEALQMAREGMARLPAWQNVQA